MLIAHPEQPSTVNNRIPDSLNIDAFTTLAFTVVCVGVALGFFALNIGPTATAHTRRRWATSIALWMVVTYALAGTGLLRELAGSMKFGLYVLACNGAAIVVALSTTGQRTASNAPTWGLVAFQSFRLPLELLLHAWYVAGVMPIQMTYEGQNFDIVTGIGAVLLAGYLRVVQPSPRVEWRLTFVFNVVGTLLLLVVMSIAMRSAPWPLRTFTDEPAVLLPLFAPYTWIASVCVAGALWGHIVTFRQLAVRRTSLLASSSSIPAA